MMKEHLMLGSYSWLTMQLELEPTEDGLSSISAPGLALQTSLVSCAPWSKQPAAR